MLTYARLAYSLKQQGDLIMRQSAQVLMLRDLHLIQICPTGASVFHNYLRNVFPGMQCYVARCIWKFKVSTTVFTMRAIAIKKLPGRM